MHRITNLLLVLLILVCGLQPKPREPKPFNTDKALACFEEKFKRFELSKEKWRHEQFLKAIRLRDSTFWEEYSRDEQSWRRRDSFQSRILSVLETLNFDSIPATDTVEAFRLVITPAFLQPLTLITLEKRHNEIWLTSQVLDIQFPNKAPFGIDQLSFSRKLHKKKPVSLDQWNQFVQLAFETEYWDLHEESWDNFPDCFTWTLESVSNPKHWSHPAGCHRKKVSRCGSLKHTAVRKLGQQLIDLSGEDFTKLTKLNLYPDS